LDHKWGRNVLKYGVGNTGATLAACFLAAPNVILTNAPADTVADSVKMWFRSADPHGPYGASTLGIGDMHFPYGLGDFVELDELL